MVLEFLNKQNGIVCTIASFDEFMFTLVGAVFKEFDLSGHCSRVEVLGKDRAENLRKQAEKIQQAHAGNGGDEVEREIRQDLADSLKNEDDWWTWEMCARGEKDPDKRDAIYREALKVLPRSIEHLFNYSVFMKNVYKDYDGAELFYRKALKIDPNNAKINGNYALFLCKVRKDNDGAEILFKKAQEFDPNMPISRSTTQIFCNIFVRIMVQQKFSIKKDWSSTPIMRILPATFANFSLHKETENKERRC